MSQRGRRRRKTWRKLWLWSLCLLALVLAGGVWAVATPVGPGAPRLVTVQEGQSVSDVAAMLREARLVRSARALAVAAYVTGKWRRIQPGRHELDPGMTGMELLDVLSRAPRATWQWLTIPEGFTVRQIAERLEEELGAADEFLSAAERPRTFESDFPLPEGSLEGYLFPDTYRIEDNQGARGVVVQMLRRFDQVVWQGLFEREAERNGRSLREVIILASLVEAEAKQEDERPIIAGVLLNRLARGQRLECDATVQYALGADRKSRLMYEDLEIESDYNTYLHEGLPPGPICNPGEASIRAALEPSEVAYLYYVARPDGSHVFSRTFAEHRAAIARAFAGGDGREEADAGNVGYKAAERGTADPCLAQAGAPGRALLPQFLELLLIVGVLIGSYYGVMWYWERSAPKEVKVPKVVGLTQREAEAVLEAIGLRATVVAQKADEEIPEGAVLEAEPPPERRVRAGRLVRLTLSSGSRWSIVPDVRDMSIDRARALLRKAGLSVGRERAVYDSKVPVGYVVSQAPDSGEQVPRSMGVDLSVSKGAAPVVTEVEPPVAPDTERTMDVQFVVPPGAGLQEVRIAVQDAQGERTVYKLIHEPGDEIVKTVSGKGPHVTVKVYVSGEVMQERTF